MGPGDSHEAAGLGVLQIGFSGGEPLVRRDLADIIRSAREAKLYTNLITSGSAWTTIALANCAMPASIRSS